MRLCRPIFQSFAPTTLLLTGLIMWVWRSPEFIAYALTAVYFIFFSGGFMLVLILPGIYWRRQAQSLREDDSQNRRQAWETLASLFVGDFDYSEETAQFTAERLRSTGYSVDVLEQILYMELYPILEKNLFSLEGEWAFDYDLENIHQRVSKQRPRRFVLVPGMWMLALGPWCKIRHRLSELGSIQDSAKESCF